VLLITLKIIHVLVCLFLIMVVLFQQGKGADLSVFGGGSTMSAFGARGAANVFHKLTVTGFVLFTITTLSISLVQSRQISSTVMDEVPVAADVTSDEAATEAASGDAAASTADAADAAEAEMPATEAEAPVEEATADTANDG
jgi:preprotein translocase subunit SecG